MFAEPMELRIRECNAKLLEQEINLHPVVKRVLSARDIQSFAEISYSLEKLLEPEKITHLSKAAQRIVFHIQQGSKILVFGDYDADGATSTALCIRALNLMGYDNTQYFLPDRVTDGYGVSVHAADNLIHVQPQLVITVDTGIASFAGLEKLHEAGIEAIVTDHHLPADKLPPASAIVNPNVYSESDGKSLAGVGVAFYLMLAVRARLRAEGWFNQRVEPNLADCLDLVAIGTIADLVPLDYMNRILVNEGLKRIRAGRCSRGISQLVEFSGRNQRRLSAQDVAFAVAPRINAAGRLDDMSIGVQALLANDEQSAYELALALDEINQTRRKMQGKVTEQAIAMLPELDPREEKICHVLYQPEWHEGIVGIIASRIKEMTFRPAISFAPAENGFIKGSCRSIPGVHIRDMLDLVDKAEPGLIERFGGHAMAAGLTLNKDHLDAFAERLEMILKQHVEPENLNHRIEYDGELTSQDLNLDLAHLLDKAGPWGQRFPVPSFRGHFQVHNQQVLVDRHLKFELTLPQLKVPLEAIRFYADDKDLKTNFETLDIHYELAINEFRGKQSLQLIIRHIL